MDMRVAKHLFFHNSLVLFSLAGGLYVVLVDNVQLGARVVDVFVPHSSCVDVDVETLA
jgi:hypothetical protein